MRATSSDVILAMLHPNLKLLVAPGRSFDCQDNGVNQSSSKFIPDAPCDSTSFHFRPIREAVEVAIQHLDIRKSTDPDGLFACFLREIAEIAVPGSN